MDKEKLFICPAAKTCEFDPDCIHKKPHRYTSWCSSECNGAKGCIPVKEREWDE